MAGERDDFSFARVRSTFVFSTRGESGPEFILPVVIVNVRVNRRVQLSPLHPSSWRGEHELGTVTNDFNTPICSLAEDIHTGTEDIHTGNEDIHTGTEDIHTGTEDIHTGTEDNHTGSKDIHTGTEDIHTGTEDIHTGTEDNHTGSKDIHTGTDDIHTGTEDIYTGSEDNHTGNEDIHTGNEDIHTGCEDIHTGSEDIHTGNEDIDPSTNTVSCGLTLSKARVAFNEPLEFNEALNHSVLIWNPCVAPNQYTPRAVFVRKMDRLGTEPGSLQPFRGSVGDETSLSVKVGAVGFVSSALISGADERGVELLESLDVRCGPAVIVSFLCAESK
ncbi:hypothetical protein EYF80_023744 [Liparis tanakae]|uniref:Uncharacterized protein n=1 Tax=Liparis tanakae TaxID=230148 RepID=A0A4Z2HJK0_9TELE|nr:hypothetical protein EYF80_023744 [Liparis tanakae]